MVTEVRKGVLAAETLMRLRFIPAATTEDVDLKNHAEAVLAALLERVRRENATRKLESAARKAANAAARVQRKLARARALS